MNQRLLLRVGVLSFVAAVTSGANSAHAHDGPPGHGHPGKVAQPGAPEPPPKPEDLLDPPPDQGDDDDDAGGPNIEPQPGSQPGSAPPPGVSEQPGERPPQLEKTSWRKRVREIEEDRVDGDHRIADLAHFVVELRFGGYAPDVDAEFDGAAAPFNDFFGDGLKFYFGLEVDWLPLYVPYVVSVGPSFGWGFTTTSAPTRTSTGTEAASDTSFTVFPMHVSAAFRFDGPLREFNFPVVPYAKLGLGWGIWSIGGPDGGDEGTSYGIHAAVGGSLALNAFDPETAKAMRAGAGIRYAYLFGEWMFYRFDLIGPSNQLRAGTSAFAVGLAIDF